MAFHSNTAANRARTAPKLKAVLGLKVSHRNPMRRLAGRVLRPMEKWKRP
jgi:hypothetical protein